ncbi:hypothetical protein Saso_34760 [Streptomyces asoensis]|uniref:Uncharacterized protein n=1 Tax=Streptomyces asoensis TaxID=249586 RepID=A0ABQ3S141_9ACTN|nr:hypothetical protein GCM10010496_28110 [Streptomyces asoensis]GHI61826.1 hypothetical protein Saso_34760 [Streptomyces asoensis]
MAAAASVTSAPTSPAGDEAEPAGSAEGEVVTPLAEGALAEGALAEGGSTCPGLTEALEEPPDWHPVKARAAAEAMTTAATEPRTPNRFPLPFTRTSLSPFPLMSLFACRMLPPNRTAGGVTPRHRLPTTRTTARMTTQTERTDVQVLPSADLLPIGDDNGPYRPGPVIRPSGGA